VLQLKALGIDNIMNFEWLSPPPAANMIKALELLYALQAVDDDARLTKPLGMHLAELPLEPQLGKALLVSGELGCVQEMLTVSAYLQVQTLWVSPRGRQKRLDECRDRFAVAEGDAVTALNVHTAWCKAGGAQGGGRARSFADKNMLSHRALVRASDISSQGGTRGVLGGERFGTRETRDDRGVLRERRDVGAARGRRRGIRVQVCTRRRHLVYSPGERTLQGSARDGRLRRGC
jgi:HrpA-like RNA helicase